MYTTVIGGGFGLEKREHSVVRKLGDYLNARTVINGGTLDELPTRMNWDLILWMPDIDNESPKQYPKKSQGNVLICSKVMREGYTDVDAISRIFKMGGNAVIAIYKNESKHKFKLLDALGNTWFEGDNLEELSNTILEFYKFTKESVRVNTNQSDKMVLASIEVPNLDKFIEVNSKLSNDIQTSCGTRFFGNLSTRCQLLFPTMRTNLGMYVSPRNVNKQTLTADDMVLTYWDKELFEVKYEGDIKPSVDTPTQLLVYDACPDVNFLIHGHAFIKDAVTTKKYYLCGDVREAGEVIELITDSNKKSGGINLKNHGFLIYADSLENLEKEIEKCEFHYEREATFEIEEKVVESKLKVVNLKVLSYCSDIPEEYQDSFKEYTCGIYIPYSLSDDPKYDQSELDLYLMKEFPELVNTEFLIDMDY